MTAPGTVLIAKMLVPETEHPLTAGRVEMPAIEKEPNILGAITQGTSDGLHLALNVAAMLITFLALLALMNAIMGWVHLQLAWFPGSLQQLFGWVFAPVAWLIGVSWHDAAAIGNLLGTRMVLNEFVAFAQLGTLKPTLDPPVLYDRHLCIVWLRELQLHWNPDRRHQCARAGTACATREVRRARNARRYDGQVDVGRDRGSPDMKIFGAGRRVVNWSSRIYALAALSWGFAAGPYAVAQSTARGELRPDLIVQHGTVVTMDANRRAIADGVVAVTSDTIAFVGTQADFARARRGGPHRRRLSTHGGSSCSRASSTGHMHVPMTLLRGVKDDVTLEEWLAKSIFPAEAENVTEDFVRWGTRLAAAEQIRAGITTFVDMYYFEDAIAEEAKAAGMRAVLGETILDFPAPDNKNTAAMLQYTEKFLKRWQGDALVHAAAAPHSDPHLLAADAANRRRPRENTMLRFSFMSLKRRRN